MSIKRLVVVSYATPKKVLATFRNLSEFNKALEDIRASIESSKEQTQNMLKSLAAIKTIRLGDENPDTLFIDGNEPRSVNKKSINIENVKKINVQNINKIASNFESLDNLVNYKDTLDQMEAELLYGNLSTGMKGQKAYMDTVRNMKTLRTQVATEQKAIREVIEKIAGDHIPAAVKDMTDSTFKTMLKLLKGSYEKSNRSVLVDTFTRGEIPVVRYTSYLQLVGFTDDSDYEHEKYYIVITTEITPYGAKGGSASTKVNTMASYRMPGKFNPGQPVSNKDKAVTMLKDILTTEGLLDLVQEIPFPISDRDVNKKSFGNLVTDVKLEKDTLSLLLNPSVKTEDDLRKILPTMYSAVKGLVNGKTKGDLRQALPTRDKKTKQYIVRYKYRKPHGEEVLLDKHALDRIQNDLGLSDYLIKKIQQVIL